VRLGTRWGFGQQPPAAVPADILEAIGAAEATIGAPGAGGSWTLTWLEGRPIAAFDDGTIVTLDDGIARIGRENDADDSDAW
jgi:hypothetical protein